MLKLRNPFTLALASLAAVLIFSSVAKAQAEQGTHKAPVWKYDGGSRAVGSGGPAPFHDLSGSWAGPRSGAGVADSKPGDLPPLTALGQQLFGGRKSLQKYDPTGTNDPVVRTCDPLGFPRVDRYSIMAMAFATMSDRIVVLYPFQQQWREIWTDGRQLPQNVGASGKDAPDPRYYGYSVGHWEGDNTLIVDTTGLDENTWLTDAGYPHSMYARVQERFTRTDYNDLELTVTVDDPKFYTKPLSLGTEYFRWVPDQILDERLCIPSNVIEYLKAVGDPAGKQP
jgi:hypothetical protein